MLLGFFWRSGGNEVAVRTWDSFHEHINSENNTSEESLNTLIQQLQRGDLNNNLGPYPLAEHHIWVNLSCFISEDVLIRAECPIDKIIYPSEADDLASLAIINNNNASKNNKYRPKETKEINKNEENDKKNDRNNEKNMIVEGNYAKFVDVLSIEVKIRDSVNSLKNHEERANNLTALYLDKSIILENLILNDYNNNYENILGEMQLSFLLFLLIYCHDALEHWKKLIDTICKSERILISKPEFTIAFMRILYEQLNFAPTDFFANELSKDNFLRPAVSALFENLNQKKGVLNNSVLEHTKRLLTFFQKKFDLFLDFYDGNYISHIEDLGINSGINSINIDDDYNLVDDDRPVVISMEEIESYNIDNSMSNSVSNNMTNNISDTNMSNNDITNDNNNNNNINDSENLHIIHPIEVLTSSQIEIEMFCWRYPNLYDAMIAGVYLFLCIYSAFFLYLCMYV